MFTATGFIVMCVAAVSTCTANAVESPPRPCGPMPRLFTASVSSSSRRAPSGSSQCVPSARVAATLARCMHRSAVPPTPTPTMVGGHTLPPASITLSTTKVLTPISPSAGMHILRKEPFPEPLPFGIISISRVSGASLNAQLITGTRMPQDVCAFSREIGCTTDERSGCSRVARSQPRRMASTRSVPWASTPRPMVTL